MWNIKKKLNKKYIEKLKNFYKKDLKIIIVWNIKKFIINVGFTSSES